MARLPLQHVFIPAVQQGAERSAGLIVLVHGTGADEHDLIDLGEALAGQAPQPMAILSLRAPLRAPFGGFRWFEGFSSQPEPIALATTVASSASALIACLEAAPTAFGTDPSKTVLVGFSQGATIGWAASVAPWPRPDLLAACCLMSGRLLPEFGVGMTPLAATVAPAEARAGRAARVWACHGAMDGTTPVPMARESARLARTLLPAAAAAAAEGGGGGVAYVEHSGGHEIPGRAIALAAAFINKTALSSCS